MNPYVWKWATSYRVSGAGESVRIQIEMQCLVIVYYLEDLPRVELSRRLHSLSPVPYDRGHSTAIRLMLNCVVSLLRYQRG
jgi:hypothetical protein